MFKVISWGDGVVFCGNDIIEAMDNYRHFESLGLYVSLVHSNGVVIMESK